MSSSLRTLVAGLVAVACAGGQMTGRAGPPTGANELDPGQSVAELREQRPADMKDVIRYRVLVRADFKAAEAPPEYRSFADRLGAATCGLIQTVPGVKIQVRSVSSQPGVFEASMPDVRYRALMDRSCSWWNESATVPEPYVLEHEQIHFAIFELAARDLNRRAPEIARDLESTADSPDAAAAIVRERYQQELLRTLASIQERSARFDQDTSYSHNPERQREWAELVERELAVP